MKLPDLKSETFPDGKRYYVTPSGSKLPSVTTVVGAQKKQAIMEWRRRVGEDVANKISRQAVDCIGEFDGVLSVIDFKTSKKIKTVEQVEDYWWQTTAYALFYEEIVGIPINDLVIIMAVENDKPIVMQQKTSDHIEGLVRAIEYFKKNS